MLVKTRTIPERLAQLLENSGLTQYQLAKFSGVPRSSISEIFSGKKIPTDEVLEKISSVLGASFEELAAYRDAAALGPNGIQRIRRFAPEVLGSIEQLLAELPEDMKFPPTARELKLLSRLGGWEGTELDPRSQSALWMVSPEERWPELKLEAEASGIVLHQKMAE